MCVTVLAVASVLNMGYQVQLRTAGHDHVSQAASCNQRLQACTAAAGAGHGVQPFKVPCADIVMCYVLLLPASCCLQLLQTDADVLLMSLLPLLTSGSEESMCEAARAVGNLARASPAVRAALCNAGSQHGEQQDLQEPGSGAQAASSSPQHASAGPYVLQSLVLLLDHGSWDVVYSVAGALVNLAALAEAGTALSRAGLAAALAGALQRVQDLWGLQDGQQQQDELDGVCMEASELLLQCVGNMVTASAAAMSDAILRSSGPRCADLSCSSEDLACFSRIVQSLAGDVEGSAGQGDEAAQQVPECIQKTARLVQSRLASLWDM